MGAVSTTKHFDTPPQVTWEVVSDFRHAADRIEGVKNMELLTDGPIGKGTRFRETRVMFGKEAVEEMEITEWNPPSHYTVECESCGARYRSVISVKPDGDGSQVEMTMDATPLSFGAKIMSAAVGWMMKGACRKAFDRDLEDLKRFAEGGGVASAAHAS